MSGEIRTNLAPQIDVSDVVDILVNMFGEIMDRGAIAAVVESYNGDLDQSTDAILKLSEDDQALRPVQPQLPLHPTMLPPNWPQGNPANQSYAMISQQRTSSTTPTVKTANKVKAHIGHPSVWTDQLKNIVTYHNKGFKTLILMRGASGAGKTYLSNAIVEITVGKERQKHVFSADDFFQKDTGYEFNPVFLEIAHKSAKMRAFQALHDGVSPVIVDNTNTQLWEMEPYVYEGVKHGYIIELVEPNTSWARNAYSLASRNTHGVTLEKVRNMLHRFEHNLTGNIIINKLRLSYPQGKIPPNIRSFPPFEPIIEKQEDNRITVTLTDDIRDHTAPSGVTVEIHKKNTDDIPKQNTVYISKKNTIDISKKNTIDISKKNTIDIPINNIPVDTPKTNAVDMSKNNTVDTPTNNKVVIPYKVTVNPINVETGEIPNEVTSSNNAVDTSKVQLTTNTDNIVNSIKEHSSQIPNNKMLPQEKPVRNNITELEIATDGESAGAKMESDNTDEVKVLAEWDLNEKWGVVDLNVLKPKIDHNETVPKHQRLPKKAFTKGDSEINMFQEIKDWCSITSYLPPWNSDTPTITKPILKRNVITHTEGTNTEAGDSKIQKTKYKVLRTECREINKYHLPETPQQIPDVRMLDKSTMTLEPNIFNERNYRCKNEEKHFLAIRSMFKTIARSDLRDVFEYCRGDPNWTVSCILDSVNTNEIRTHDEDVSDCEDIVDEPCDCVAKYQVIPYVEPTEEDKIDSVTDPAEHKNIVSVSNRKKRRTKGQTATLESNLLLKKQLEESVSISGAHYSPQTLKLRNERHGRSSLDNISALSFISNNDEQDSSSSDQSLENASMNVLDNTSENNESENEMFAMSDSDIEMSSEYDDKERQEDFISEEKTVFVGYELIKSIGKMFNEDFVYPKGVLPLITMPKSLINEIHALWLESLSHQLTCQEEFGNMMVKEDEEFARKLAAKEEEMARQGKEPEVPDFKEIMDMDLALSIYQKEIADWKNKEPTDLASKMTRDKLYNLFPDKSKETLSEILIAYNNDFKTTVEVLLSSIGRHDILKKKNGLNKFIMDGELARQKRVMDEQKLQRSKEKPAKTGGSKNGKKFTLAHVFEFRQRAQMHLDCRNKFHQKAQTFLNTDHTGCAYYYSSCAKYHKHQFEFFNGHAASALIQVHAQTNADTTLDLHYLYVAEAIEAIDLFVDHHIQVVRASRAGRREHVYIVTGRGIHSNGKPKIKPAAICRLKQRGFDIVELNPGLLAIELRSSSQLMSEMKKKEPPPPRK